ncbi:MAG: hypothetical protein RLZZ427_944, partial [Pseudomonadota bacterium]
MAEDATAGTGTTVQDGQILDDLTNLQNAAPALDGTVDATVDASTSGDAPPDNPSQQDSNFSGTSSTLDLGSSTLDTTVTNEVPAGTSSGLGGADSGTALDGTSADGTGNGGTAGTAATTGAGGTADATATGQSDGTTALTGADGTGATGSTSTDGGASTTQTQTATGTDGTATTADTTTTTAATTTQNATASSTANGGDAIPGTATTDTAPALVGGSAAPPVGTTSGAVSEAPGLTISKAVDQVLGSDGQTKAVVSAAGDQVTFSVTVSNTGNTLLSNVTISDPLASGGIIAAGIQLAPGETATYTFSYAVTQQDITTAGGGDNLLDSSSSVVSDQTALVSADAGVAIASATPVFTNTSVDANGTPLYTFSYAENSASGAVLGTVSASDADGNALTYSITGGNPNGWYAIDSATGAITLTAAGAASLANDFEQAPNSQTLTVAVSDGTAVTTIQVALGETNVNDNPPVITSDPQSGTVTDDGTQTIGGTISAADLDAGTSLTFSGSASGTYGVFAIDPITGRWTYTLDNAANQALAEGETHTETFTVTVTDNNGTSTTQAVTVTVVGTNDVPVINGALQTATLTEDTAGSASGTIVASDVDNGAVLAYSGNANGAYGTFAIDPATGQWVYTVNAGAVQALAAGESHDETFTVTVTDDQGATATQVVTVTVTGTNDAP